MLNRYLAVLLFLAGSSFAMAGSTSLSLTDDSFAEVDIGFDFPFYRSDYSSVFVGSNGYLTFGSGDANFTPTVSELLDGAPRIAGLWDDLFPPGGGTVTVDSGLNSLTVEWNVPECCGTLGPDDANNFAITLHPTGMIDVTWGGLTATGDAIVGISPGGGNTPAGYAFDVFPGVNEGSGAVGILTDDAGGVPVDEWLYRDDAIYEVVDGGSSLQGDTIHFYGAIPEPASLSLLALGAVAILGRKRS